ncbi:YidH family protein [Panacagrimonas sp.]|uniref:YidH family protein n=1 Tax=Panacagrimonas sp. TaxID=2480088 RepID=UPI003B51F2F8
MSYLQDPRVLFAAERTLMAWSRTSVALIGFGFLIERFRLFEQLVNHEAGNGGLETASFLVGLAFIGLGAIISATSAYQYVRVLKDLNPAEIPRGYWIHQGTLLNVVLSLAAITLLILLAASGL